jgi:uncharacterized protein (TIGR04222 family)
MDIILHNFIADMPGPVFLGFYALTIVATLYLCWILKHLADYSRFLPLPSVPEQPDPYELAYLRNGEKEVARLAVFSLIQQGLLKIGPKSEQRVQQASTGISSASQLCPMERCVFDWFAQPRRKLEVASNELPSLVKPFCAGYQRHLEEERLLTSSGMKSATHFILLLGVLIVVGLGGYKGYITLMKGYQNVRYFVLMSITAILMLIPVCKVPHPRLSARGRKYLDQLQIAFGPLKDQITTKGTKVDGNRAYLLTIGLFGTSILLLTPYADYYWILHPVTTSSSGDREGKRGN